MATVDSSTGATSVEGISRDYWYIHGKAYDLTDFVDKHPGGKSVLLDTRGRNVTEMFESVHALSTRDISQIMKKYEVPGVSVIECPFTFKEDGVYSEIRRRVRQMFASRPKGQQSHKATWLYWLQLVVMLAFHFTGLYLSMVRGYRLAAFATGCWWMVLMFYGIVHDASHFALSQHEFVNKWFSIVSCHWGLWHSSIWFQHHCYGHHSYTGLAESDPDLRNGTKLIRKHPHFPWKSFHRYQHVFMFVLYLFLPNQYIGQVIEYAKARKRGRIFGLQLVDSNTTKTAAEYTVSYGMEFASIFIHFILPFIFLQPLNALLIVWLYWAGVGMTYYAIVAPNHDTHDTRKDDMFQGVDWGEQQILHSSNFSHGNPLLTSLFGGMNYQIEHHLFPTVCNIHYPAISKVVREVCKERGLQYNYLPSVFDAHLSVFRNYYYLGQLKKQV